jgi:hypothetical protein
LSLYLLIKHCTTKTYGRVEVQLHNFLIVAINADEWTHSQPKYFIPRERALGTHVKQAEAQSQFRWYREEKNLYLCSNLIPLSLSGD